ncbi:hypothetical protein JCM11251_007881 [Rhodosporidiobolus azoricus]
MATFSRMCRAFEEHKALLDRQRSDHERLRAIELSTSDNIGDLPQSTELYLRLMQAVQAIGLDALLDPDQVEQKAQIIRYVAFVEAEDQAFKAEEKLLEAALDAVLARDEMKRSLRQQKLDGGGSGEH